MTETSLQARNRLTGMVQWTGRWYNWKGRKCYLATGHQRRLQQTVTH